MKNIFVHTKNVKLFNDGINAINHKLKGVERMLLVTGEPGLGKTETSISYCAQNGAVMIRTLQLMTGPWLLRKIVEELGSAPEKRISAIFDQIIDLQKTKPRTIILDEVDRFAEKTEILETIRDIHDVCHCPIVFVGEEMADKKLMRYRRLYRRFVGVVKFEKLDKNDVRDFVTSVADINIDVEAIDRMASESAGKISDIVNWIHHVEAWAHRNQAKKVGIKDIWKS